MCNHRTWPAWATAQRGDLIHPSGRLRLSSLAARRPSPLPYADDGGWPVGVRVFVERER